MRVIVETLTDFIEGTCSRFDDLDGVFILTDDDGNKFKIYGWQSLIEVIQPPQVPQ